LRKFAARAITTGSKDQLQKVCSTAEGEFEDGIGVEEDKVEGF